MFPGMIIWSGVVFSPLAIPHSFAIDCLRILLASYKHIWLGEHNIRESKSESDTKSRDKNRLWKQVNIPRKITTPDELPVKKNIRWSKNIIALMMRKSKIFWKTMSQVAIVSIAIFLVKLVEWIDSLMIILLCVFHVILPFRWHIHDFSLNRQTLFFSSRYSILYSQ